MRAHSLPPFPRRVIVFAREKWLIILLTACATTHPANPTLYSWPAGVSGETEVVYYDVHGRTAAELRADMRRVGPKSESGTIYAGETHTPLSWGYRTRSDGSMCTIWDIRMHASAKITLPGWTPPRDTVPGLWADWKQSMAGLELHEIGHKDITARYAVLIMRKLKEVNTFCSAVNNEARRVPDTLLVQLREEQERYDRDTRHGLTQGAGFPPRRAAPVPS